MHRLLAAWVIASAACGGASEVASGPQPPRGSDTAIAQATTASVTFAPSSAAALWYNEPLPAAPRSPLADVIARALETAAGEAHLPTPIADARLFRACEQLAAIVPEQGVIDNGFVEFALQRNGIIEPSPHLLVLWGDDAPDAVIAQIQPHLAEILADGATARFGVGVVTRGTANAIVFALQGSGITTSPIPRSLPRSGAVAIDAVMDSHYRDPEVFVTHDDGTTDHAAVAIGRAGAFKADFACSGRTGRQQIEISADDARGATVLANFPVWCGSDPPEAVTIAASPDDADVATPDEAEQRLFALANRDRAAAHLPALAWDARVAKVARAYAEEMRSTKIVAHVSPTSGTVADRLHAGNIRTAVMLENVARAYGAGEANSALMNSPGHRANLLSTTATHIGIGVALGDEENGRREMFVAQVFIRIPPKIDASAVAELVRARITALRPAAADPQLVAIAGQLAAGFAAGQPREVVWPPAKAALDQLGNRYARVASVITAYADPAAIDAAALLGDVKPSAIGVGIAQGVHPEIGEGAIWVVVLVGENQ